MGGTGKTPTVIKLYNITKKLNFNVVTAKKFYKDEKDEQIRDVRGDGVYIDDDPFTSPDVVPILIVNDEEDDFGEEEE